MIGIESDRIGSDRIRSPSAFLSSTFHLPRVHFHGSFGAVSALMNTLSGACARHQAGIPKFPPHREFPYMGEKLLVCFKTNRGAAVDALKLCFKTLDGY